MKKFDNDYAYSMEEGSFYLPGSDIDRLINCGISTDKVDYTMKTIGISTYLYDGLINSFYEEDIMRWSVMFTIAVLALKESCIQGNGYTIEIVEQGTYYDNYTVYINGILCFQLQNTWSSDNISYKISYIKLGYLDRIILDDYSEDPIMDALFISPYNRRRVF